MKERKPARLGQVTRPCCTSTENNYHDDGCPRAKFEAAECIRAAAPDMLAALEAIAAILGHRLTRRAFQSYLDDDTRAKFDEHKQTARAAIAKAKGADDE